MIGGEDAVTGLNECPWRKLYPSGIAGTLDVRHRTMLELWDDTVRRRADAPCVYYFDAEFGYRRIDEESDALAVSLLEGGLQPGERVGILLQNDPQWPVALLATWKAGAIAVSLSPMLKSRELGFQLDDAKVAVLVCLRDLYRDAAESAVADTSVRRVLTTHSGEWGGPSPEEFDSESEPTSESAPDSLRAVIDAATGRRPRRPPLNPQDVAVLTYTSGTTGPAKGAMLTHAGLSHNSQLPIEWFRLDAEEPILGMAPLFHVTGLVLHLGASWYAGCPLILSHRFDPEQILRSIQHRRPAFTIAAITAFIALLEHPAIDSYDLSSLQVVASGGAPVNVGVVNRFRKLTGLTIVSVYGLTETTSPSHLTPLHAVPPVDEESGALSVGVPVPGAHVEVVDIETTEVVGPGVVGELVIQGPMVVPGYWNQPEQTAHAIPGGRLFTGDVGVMTPEGWFFVVDRKKDLIVASGYKVWPREVEEVLYEHPSVREAVVVGEPDEYRGETVVAWIVPAASERVEEAELIAFCRERLAAYKYPRQISIVSEIPKTSSGKILRRGLRGRHS